MAPFGFGGRAAKVVGECAAHLVLGELLADAECSEIVGVVAHARVFPVDEVDMIIVADEEVEAEEVVVAQDGIASIGDKHVVELRCLRLHLGPVLHIDASAF